MECSGICNAVPAHGSWECCSCCYMFLEPGWARERPAAIGAGKLFQLFPPPTLPGAFVNIREFRPQLGHFNSLSP